MNKAKIVAGVAALIVAAGANAQISGYSQDFEGFPLASGAGDSSLADDGWLVGANVFASDGITFLYNYFAFPAPNFDGSDVNNTPRFSNIQTGQGGVDQGDRQLAIFSDYNNGAAQQAGDIIEANVFKEWTVDGTTDAGIWQFDFDYKNGNIGGSMSAVAFIKVLDPGNNFQGAVITLDTTDSGDVWQSGSLQANISAANAGWVFQIGFWTKGSNFDPSTVFYDNLSLSQVPAPGAAALLGLGALATRRRRA